MNPKDRPTEWITALAAAILGLLMAFGVNLTDDQAAAIMVVVGFVPAIVTGAVVYFRGLGKDDDKPLV